MVGLHRSRAGTTAGAGTRRKAGKGRPRLAPELVALVRQAASASRMLKSIANEKRLLILCFLAARREMNVGDLVEAIGLSQSALSQHLARLRGEGLVTYRRESQTLHYRIANADAERILKLLKDIYCGDLN